MLDLGKLIALREVSLQGSMTGAAQSLRITVSAVSQQIAKLENDLEVALLEPLGRGVQLTSAAHELIAAAETALASLEEAESEATQSWHGDPHFTYCRVPFVYPVPTEASVEFAHANCAAYSY